MTLYLEQPKQVDAVKVIFDDDGKVKFSELAGWLITALKEGHIRYVGEGLAHFEVDAFVSTKPLTMEAYPGDWVVYDMVDTIVYSQEELDSVFVSKEKYAKEAVQLEWLSEDPEEG